MVALLVILTVLVALAVDALVLARKAKEAAGAPAATPIPMQPPQPPQGVFVDAGHSWVRITSDGRLRIGIDDFLAEAIGSVESVEVPPSGKAVKRGEPLAKLRVRGRTLALPSPVTGTVTTANDRTQRDPDWVTRDPYGSGWLVTLWTRDHHAAIEPLRIGAAATHFLREELHRFADFLTPQRAAARVPVLADGGLPGHGSAAVLPDAAWDAFQKEFVPGSSDEG